MLNEEKKLNPFRGLRKPGRKGRKSKNWADMTLYLSSREIISFRFDKIDEDAWDYGYGIRLSDDSYHERIPGGNYGWFKSEWDALKYGMAAIKLAFQNKLSPTANQTLDDNLKSWMTK